MLKATVYEFDIMIIYRHASDKSKRLKNESAMQGYFVPFVYVDCYTAFIL